MYHSNIPLMRRRIYYKILNTNETGKKPIEQNGM